MSPRVRSVKSTSGYRRRCRSRLDLHERFAVTPGSKTRARVPRTPAHHASTARCRAGEAPPRTAAAAGAGDESSRHSASPRKIGAGEQFGRERLAPALLGWRTGIQQYHRDHPSLARDVPEGRIRRRGSSSIHTYESGASMHTAVVMFATEYAIPPTSGPGSGRGFESVVPEHRHIPGAEEPWPGGASSEGILVAYDPSWCDGSGRDTGASSSAPASAWYRARYRSRGKGGPPPRPAVRRRFLFGIGGGLERRGDETTARVQDALGKLPSSSGHEEIWTKPGAEFHASSCGSTRCGPPQPLQSHPPRHHRRRRRDAFDSVVEYGDAGCDHARNQNPPCGSTSSRAPEEAAVTEVGTRRSSRAPQEEASDRWLRRLERVYSAAPVRAARRGARGSTRTRR